MHLKIRRPRLGEAVGWVVVAMGALLCPTAEGATSFDARLSIFQPWSMTLTPSPASGNRAVTWNVTVNLRSVWDPDLMFYLPNIYQSATAPTPAEALSLAMRAANRRWEQRLQENIRRAQSNRHLTAGQAAGLRQQIRKARTFGKISAEAGQIDQKVNQLAWLGRECTIEATKKAPLNRHPNRNDPWHVSVVIKAGDPGIDGRQPGRRAAVVANDFHKALHDALARVLGLPLSRTSASTVEVQG